MKKDQFKIGDIKDLNHLIWDEKNRKTILNTPIFDLVEINRESKQGLNSNFYALDSPDWVTIIPWYLNEDNKPCFVMVQQFRHGSSKIVREFPAGMVDKGEKAIDSAFRELREETALSTDEMIFLSKVNPNPAIMQNTANFFLAKNVYKIADQQKLDATEQLDVVSVLVSEVIEKLGTDPLYDNGVMLMALSLFLKHTKIDPSLI
ncbi:MAG: NUDIX hydrolase [Sphaerochaetaceae bacterium]|jgi:8-oxo-dGTP pyrophosphatase MutT (NUDIX family)|nr:NUDIX hydrolase [Sphaerochaetaceae bacterium]MDC7250178.1 NUDIX hydrolase [Sphaerochaetaceae bacterium]